MATTNEILSEIAAYSAANGRPCPAKHLSDKFGTGVLDQIATLKKDGKVYGKRGRTGGLKVLDAGSEVSTDAPADDGTASDLASEFAALAAKLATEAEAADPAVAVG